MKIRSRTAIAAVAVASVVGGGLVGAVLAGPATAAAQETGVDDEATTIDRHTTLDDVLGELVDEGVITQAQADVIGERLRAAHAERGGRGHFGRAPHLGAALDDVAGLLGLSVDDLAAALRDGGSIADVAADQGVDVQDVIDLLVQNAQERLDEAVAAGRLAADEAAEKLTEIESRVTAMVNGELEMKGRHGPGMRRFGEGFDLDGNDADATGADA